MQRTIILTKERMESETGTSSSPVADSEPTSPTSSLIQSTPLDPYLRSRTFSVTPKVDIIDRMDEGSNN